MIKLKPLYKKTKTNDIQVCEISVENDTFTVLFGKLDGKMQTNTTTCYPKNVGRSNETTPGGQALMEANAKWELKVKGGYSESQDGDSEVLLPMKVKTYQGQEKNVIFPCWLSPKLNGVNGEFRGRGTRMELLSRGGNQYPMIEHLASGIQMIMQKLNVNSLNGEIYKHGMHLQDITSAVKKTKDSTKELEFHIFELPDLEGDYVETIFKLEELYTGDNAVKYEGIKVIPITKAYSHEDIEAYHTKMEAEGYEGIVIRNSICTYQYNIRSSNAFKYKKAKDAEYKIVGYNIDKHKHAVFVCTTGSHEFSVKMKGTNAERLAVAAEADSHIGKWMKIEFEDYSKDNKPLKPVGIIFRECDSEGNPVE